MSKVTEYSGSESEEREEQKPAVKVNVKAKQKQTKRKGNNSSDVQEEEKPVARKKVAKKSVSKLVKKALDVDEEKHHEPSTPTKKGKKGQPTDEEKAAIRLQFEEKKKTLTSLFQPLIDNARAEGKDSVAKTYAAALESQIEGAKKETGFFKIVDISPEDKTAMMQDLKDSLLPHMTAFLEAKTNQKEIEASFDNIQPKLFFLDSNGVYQPAQISKVRQVIRKWQASEDYKSLKQAEEETKSARSVMTKKREELKERYNGQLFFETPDGKHQNVTFPKVDTQFQELVEKIRTSIDAAKNN